METLTWDNLQKDMDEYFRTNSMFIDDGYPIGSDNDNAPWNQSDEEELDPFDYLEYDPNDE